ncbi:MAG: ATP-grasp domain-containing protein [bacterium]|nr:ATP-grasp domain-containing protein [bacterium]
MNSKNKKTILIIYDTFSAKELLDDPSLEYTPEEAHAEIADVRLGVKNICDVLKNGGYDVRTLGLRYVNSKIISKIEKINPDAIFNLCESLYDKAKNEVYVAGLFELLKIPYTGAPPFALAVALNKFKTKQILRAAGLPTPASILTIKDQPISLAGLNPPYIIKPIREDASAGITSRSVVRTKEEVEARVKLIHNTYNQPALVEEYIDGREINVSIMGNGEPKVLAVGEILFGKMPKGEPRIISYQAKWDPSSPLYAATEQSYPAQLDEKTRIKIGKIGLQAYKEIGCRDYGRIDMRMRADGKVFILEVNPNPAISPDDGFERAAGVAGISYNEMLCKIVSYALARSSRKTLKEIDIKSVI